MNLFEILGGVTMSKKILIKGLRCEKCPIHIAQKLSDVAGVEKIEKKHG